MASHGASEDSGFQWKLRRQVARLADYFEKGTTKKYPKTSDALDTLRSAVDAEMRQRRKGVKVDPTTDQPPAKQTKGVGRRGSTNSWLAASSRRT